MSVPEELKQMSEDYYCRMIQQAKKTESLGWETKVKQGEFGKKELKAHEEIGKLFGMHVAFMEAYIMVVVQPHPKG